LKNLYPLFTTSHSKFLPQLFHYLELIAIEMLLLLNSIFFSFNIIFLNISHAISSALGGDYVTLNYPCGTIRDICLVLEVYLGLLNFVSIMTLIYGMWSGKLSTWIHS
jgi:hypothetical protein